MSAPTESKPYTKLSVLDKIVAALAIKTVTLSENGVPREEITAIITEAVDKIIALLAMNTPTPYDPPIPVPVPIPAEVVATAPAVTESDEAPQEMNQEEIATIKKAFITVIAIFAGLFVIFSIFSPKYRYTSPTMAPPAASGAVVFSNHKTAKKHHVHHSKAIGHVREQVATPEELFQRSPRVHHLYDQEYSLTWKDMGSEYTYRVYYADNRQMNGATQAFYKPVEGTTYRFTMSGDANNVWMAVAPVDANNHEGVTSKSVNIGHAAASK